MKCHRVIPIVNILCNEDISTGGPLMSCSGMNTSETLEESSGHETRLD